MPGVRVMDRTGKMTIRSNVGSVKEPLEEAIQQHIVLKNLC